MESETDLLANPLVVDDLPALAGVPPRVRLGAWQTLTRGTGARAVPFLQVSERPPSWLSMLEGAGWSVVRVTDPARAKRLVEQPAFAAGLAECPADPDHWVHDILRDSTGTAWLLLVQPDCLRHERVRETIVDSCFDFRTLPADPERLSLALGHAYGMGQLGACAGVQRHEVPLRHGIVGDSPAVRSALRKLERVARSEVPVLLTGETGTGKEIAARALHDLSPRRGRPFVVVNCASLPPTLIQSELFGYERGAFTGASSRHIGRLEAASDGTLFIDEIGELPANLQTNLLRFLQERTLERLGGRQTIEVDVRIVAATNVDLESAVAADLFREDLYYRLNVVPIQLPPLRERGDDVLHLAHYFLERFKSDRPGRGTPLHFTKEAVKALKRHPWPGNVRELINRVRCAMVLAEGRWIGPEDLNLSDGKRTGVRATLAESRHLAERTAIRDALRGNDDNVSRAARELGISRVTLYRLMEKHAVCPRE